MNSVCLRRMATIGALTVTIVLCILAQTSGEIDRRERSLQIVHMALVQLAKAIAEGDIRMTLADLDKLIRLEAFLSNEPESRHELVLNELRGKSDKELREMVRQEADVLREIGGDAGMNGGQENIPCNEVAT